FAETQAAAGRLYSGRTANTRASRPRVAALLFASARVRAVAIVNVRPSGATNTAPLEAAAVPTGRSAITANGSVPSSHGEPSLQSGRYVTRTFVVVSASPFFFCASCVKAAMRSAFAAYARVTWSACAREVCSLNHQT